MWVDASKTHERNDWRRNWRFWGAQAPDWWPDFRTPRDALGLSGSIGVRVHKAATAKDERRRQESDCRCAAEEMGRVQSRSSNQVAKSKAREEEAHIERGRQGQYHRSSPEALGGQESGSEEVAIWSASAYKSRCLCLKSATLAGWRKPTSSMTSRASLVITRTACALPSETTLAFALNQNGWHPGAAVYFRSGRGFRKTLAVHRRSVGRHGSPVGGNVEPPLQARAGWAGAGVRRPGVPCQYSPRFAASMNSRSLGA